VILVMEPLVKLKVTLAFDRSGELLGVALKSGLIKISLSRLRGLRSAVLVITVYDLVVGLAMEIWNELSYDTASSYFDKILDFLSGIEDYVLVVEGVE